MADIKLDPIEVTQKDPFDFDVYSEPVIEGQTGKEAVFDKPGMTTMGEDSPFAFDVYQEEGVGPEVNVSNWDTFFFNTLRAFPGSAVDVAKSYVYPVMHPVETYKNVKSVIKGFGELQEYKAALKDDPKLNLPVTDNMRAAMAVADYYAERYGDVVGEDKDSWDVVGKKVLRTIETDPAGFLADATIVFQGPGAAIRGTGKLTKGLGNVTGNQTLQKLGTEIGAQGKKLTDIGGKVEPISQITKIGMGPVKAITDFVNPKGTANATAQSFKYGREGGEVNQKFKDAMRGKVTESDILADINAGAFEYKNRLQKDFGTFEQSISGTKGDFKLLDQLKDSIKKMEDDLYIKSTDDVDVGTGVINPKTGKEYTKPQTQTKKTIDPDAKQVDLDALDQMNGIFEKYKLIIGQGLDGKNILSMKQQLQQIQSPKYKNILKQLDNTAKNDLKSINKNTDDVFSSYSKMKKDLDKLQQAIGRPDRELTQISKIGQAIKDTPRGNQALKSIDQISKELGDNSLPQLYGTNLSSPLSTRGVLPSLLLGGGGIGIGLDLIDSLLLGGGAAIASSPRILGETANILGRGTKYLPEQTIPVGMPVSRSLEMLGNEQFPIDNVQTIDYQINPNLFDPDFLAR